MSDDKGHDESHDLPPNGTANPPTPDAGDSPTPAAEAPAPDAGATPPTPDAPPAPPTEPFAPPAAAPTTPLPSYPGQQPPQYYPPTQQYPGRPDQPTQQYPPQQGQGQPPYPAAPAPSYGQQPHPGYGNQPPQPFYPGPGGPGQQGPGGPGGPGQQGSGGPGQPRKRGLSTGALVGIILGAVALVVIIVIVLVTVVVSQFARPGDGDGTGSGGGTAEGASPSEVVTAYLTAIADGDAETALGYLSEAPDDDTLLTDEVLEVSSTLGPITDISAVDGVVDNGSGDVLASYSIDGVPVEIEFSVLDYDDDGVWEIGGGLGYLSITKFDGLFPTVNGVPVEGDELEVFPGTYEFATELPNFAISGTTIVTVTEPYASADLADTTPTLSEAGLQTFRSLVRASVDACVASTTLAAGCGLEIPVTLDDGTQLTDGTIKRTLPADTATTLDSLEVTLSYDNPTLAQGGYIGAIDVEAQCTQSGQTGTCSLLFGPSLGTPSVDLASDSPTVLWD